MSWIVFYVSECQLILGFIYNLVLKKMIGYILFYQPEG